MDKYSLLNKIDFDNDASSFKDFKSKTSKDILVRLSLFVDTDADIDMSYVRVCEKSIPYGLSQMRI